MQINMPNYLNKASIRVGLIFFLLASQCKKESHLSIQTMSNILLQMHLAESYSQILPKENTTIMTKNIDSLKNFDAAIFKEFHTTKEEFEQSLNYYKSKPELLDSIYQIIMNETNLLQKKH